MKKPFVFLVGAYLFLVAGTCGEYSRSPSQGEPLRQSGY
jgi:hypothetical protein